MLYPLSYEGRGMDWLHQTVLLTLCTDRALGVRLLGVPDLRGARHSKQLCALRRGNATSHSESVLAGVGSERAGGGPPPDDHDPPGRAVTARCGHLLRDTHTPGVGSSSRSSSFVKRWTQAISRTRLTPRVGAIPTPTRDGGFAAAPCAVGAGRVPAPGGRTRDRLISKHSMSIILRWTTHLRSPSG